MALPSSSAREDEFQGNPRFGSWVASQHLLNAGAALPPSRPGVKAEVAFGVIDGLVGYLCPTFRTSPRTLSQPGAHRIPREAEPSPAPRCSRSVPGIFLSFPGGIPSAGSLGSPSHPAPANVSPRERARHRHGRTGDFPDIFYGKKRRGSSR